MARNKSAQGQADVTTLVVDPQRTRPSPAEWLACFEREAKVLASLNHPNIGHIHSSRLGPSEGR